MKNVNKIFAVMIGGYTTVTTVVVSKFIRSKSKSRTSRMLIESIVLAIISVVGIGIATALWDTPVVQDDWSVQDNDDSADK